MNTDDLKDIKEEVKKKSNSVKKEENKDNDKLLKEIEELKKVNQELEVKSIEISSKNGELQQDYLRLRADFENFRKRKEKELDEARERALNGFIEELLPSIDNFEMSLKMTDNTQMFVKGVEMIHKSLIEKLNENHIQAYEPLIGEEYDVHKHDPIPVESENNKDVGKVLEVLKKGYMHKKSEKVIRPARVKISIKKEKEQKNKKTTS